MNKRKKISEQQSTDAEKRKFDMLVKNILGKSLNVYSAQPNTNQNFLKTYRIISVKPLGTIGTKVILSVDDNETHNRTDLVKTCGRKAFENANSVGGKNRFLYSDKLNDMLEKNFCTRSKGGSVVPTADFAAADQSGSQAMTESKKVIRLTEADLVRLVKRVIKEQPQDDSIQEFNEKVVILKNASTDTVQKVLNNLPSTIKFLSILDCKSADFLNVDICGMPNLEFVSLKGTPNNFKIVVDCDYAEIGNGLFDFSPSGM